MRVVILEGSEQRFFIVAFCEDGGEALECLLGRVLAKKSLDEHIVYDLTRLRTGGFVDSVNFKQVVGVVDERRLKPANPVEKKREVFWRVDGLLYQVRNRLAQNPGGLLCRQNELIYFLR